MIDDVPTSADLSEQGVVFLNLAWDSVCDLVLTYKEAEDGQWFVDKEQSEHYVKASQKPLSIATALLQQGTEFLLKAEIAKVSPFLLISGSSQGWPKRPESGSVSFSVFKTIDAEDLVKMHDLVSGRTLTPAFVDRFNELRKTRNTIFHSLNPRLRFSEKEIVLTVLRVCTELLGPCQWIGLRATYLESTPSAAFAIDSYGGRLAREFGMVFDLIEPSEISAHFGFEKKQRAYTCPHCLSNCRENYDELIPRTARLRPNTPESTTVYCVVCRTETKVTRRTCGIGGCKGNVVNDDDYCDTECLTCGESVETPDT